MESLLVGSGKGIGPFRLLSHVGEVLQDILERTHDSRDVLITYDPKEPLLMDLEVELPEDGIRMRFDPKFQRMKIIEVFDLSKANFICEKSLASVGKVGNLSHRAIISRFGMTFPGVILLDSREYILEYPGLSFSFPLPKDCDISLLSARERLYNLEEHIKVSDRIRLDSIKIDAERFYASKMFVYSGKDFLEFAETHSKILEKTREICQVHSGKGVYFPQKDKWIDFECSSQDILADFGSPSDIVQKPGKFIFNYFHLGIDVVFESGSSDVKKVVLHTNLVSRPEFNRYTKANFIVLSKPSENAELDPSTAVICSESKLNQVEDILGKTGSPMMHHGDGDFLQADMGATYFYAFDGIIFEVTSTFHISSAIVFSSNTK